MYLKAATLALVVVVLSLQYALWFGKANIIDFIGLQGTVTQLESENIALKLRNDRLHADVHEIKSRLEAIEALARAQLGLIKPGETYYQIVVPEDPGGRSTPD